MGHLCNFLYLVRTVLSFSLSIQILMYVLFKEEEHRIYMILGILLTNYILIKIFLLLLSCLFYSMG